MHEGFGCAAYAPPEFELRGETSPKVWDLVGVIFSLVRLLRRAHPIRSQHVGMVLITCEFESYRRVNRLT